MLKTIRLNEIKNVTENYRLASSEEDVSSLMNSIKSTGLLNPLTVRKVKGGYKLIAGFRRYNACKKLKLADLDVNVINGALSDTAVNLVENMHRENTSSYEVGRGIFNIMKKDKLTAKEASVLLGMNINTLKTYLTLFKETPVAYRDCVKTVKVGTSSKAKKGEISNSTASAIINLKKAGEITATQTKELFALAKKDSSIGTRRIKGLGSEMKRSGSKDVSKSVNSTISFVVNFKMSKSHKRKLGANAHDKIRKLVEKEFKVKMV